MLPELNTPVWRKVFLYAGKAPDEDWAQYCEFHVGIHHRGADVEHTTHAISRLKRPTARRLAPGFRMHGDTPFDRDDAESVIALSRFDYLKGWNMSVALLKLKDGRIAFVEGGNFHHAEPGQVLVSDSLDELIPFIGLSYRQRLGIETL